MSLNKHNDKSKNLTWINKLTTVNSCIYICLFYFRNKPFTLKTIISTPYSKIFFLFIRCIIFSISGHLISNLYPKYTNVAFNIIMSIRNIYLIQYIYGRKKYMFN